MKGTVATSLKAGSESDVERVDPNIDEEPLTLDTIFEALKNERRRQILTYLRGAEGPLDLGDIAERIAAAENDKPIEEVTYDERKRVYVALYQCHLPKMDEMGIISFQQSSGEVSLTDRAAQLDPYLGHRHHQRDWYQYYGLTVVSGLAVLIGAVGVGASLPIAAYLALSVLIVGTGSCTAVHAWTAQNRR